MLNWIWELDATFTNYWLPHPKLEFKQRDGAKLTNRPDTATTPHLRVIAHHAMRRRPIITMNAAFKTIQPGALSRQSTPPGQLETLAHAKRPAPVKPPVSPIWNNTGWRRKPHEATNLTCRRYSHEATGGASSW